MMNIESYIKCSLIQDFNVICFIPALVALTLFNQRRVRLPQSKPPRTPRTAKPVREARMRVIKGREGEKCKRKAIEDYSSSFIQFLLLLIGQIRLDCLLQVGKYFTHRSARTSASESELENTLRISLNWRESND